MNKLKILIVDDSVVFRSQIRAALEKSPEFEVVGVANNGKIALQKLEQSSVDLITLDMEMPEMNGIETIKEIKNRKFPVKILVFSSSTKKGSEEALKALMLGADDILCKPQATTPGVGLPIDLLFEELTPKVKQFVKVNNLEPAGNQNTATVVQQTEQAKQQKLIVPNPKLNLSNFRPQIILIGCSTGGPVALERVLKPLSGYKLTVPLLITQHMPPMFTESLAKRIQEQSGISCSEAKDRQVLENKIYVAPGDFHMCIENQGGVNVLSLNKKPQRNSVRPAVDYTFETAAEIYKNKVLGIILTGMGEDGLVGSKAIKNNGGAILIQDKESCTVFGMPGAIFANNIQDEIASLERISDLIKFSMVKV